MKAKNIGNSAKDSNTLQDVVFKIIHDVSYHGPVIIFDLREKSLSEKGFTLSGDEIKEVAAYISDYIKHYEQMNSFILTDDHRHCVFYATKEICELLQGKRSEMVWAGVFPNSHYVPCVPNEIQRKGHVHGWCHAEKGYSFGLLMLKSVPESYMQFNHVLFGVENYLPEVVYWVMEALIDYELYYPPMCNESRELWNRLPPKKIQDPYMRIWHKHLKL